MMEMISANLLTYKNLDWGQHVSEISCKATKTMGFLRCNLALAPRHTKESNRKALNRNWSNHKANPALKTKAGNK